MTDELSIKNIRIEYHDFDAMAILANVNGEEELEWLDEDGDVTPCDCHLYVNRSDVFTGDEIMEIHAKMQEFIDAMDDNERHELYETCQRIFSEREAAYEAMRHDHQRANREAERAMEHWWGSGPD